MDPKRNIYYNTRARENYLASGGPVSWEIAYQESLTQVL